METKQVIVVRKDLKMRQGKACAQSAHACVNVLLELFTVKTTKNKVEFNLTLDSKDPIWNWLNTGHAKICLYVNSENELLEIYNKAIKAGIRATIITDSGRTEFHGVSTKTCVALGPGECSKIDQITKDLKLL